MDKELDFIAKRYRRGCFDTDAGWKKLGIGEIPLWRRYRGAAAVVAAVVISASASIIYYNYQTDDRPKENILPDVPVMPLNEVKVIDFENASLTEVVAKIESVYNVKIENVPQEDTGQRLSLHYEGTPTDLIDIINGILGSQMRVTEK